ncbi:CYTH domain-containing protein [Microbacterium sp. X-17]|uniref:CYTH domain-containing protein n=1 Tax=Microbacterium sp. X-17 TaxID=3144404 RepID=UPI0031F4A184
MSDPSHSLEVERKYDVDDATPLPDWTALPGVASVGEPEVRELDARYFDTDDLALGRAHVAVRRREGGPDAGWHVKASATEGRHEWHWPLDAGEADAVPDAVAQAVAEWARPPFSPLARIRNTRTAYALRDAEGRAVAEVVDDHVRARAERTGVEQAWREWEVELAEAAPADAEAFFRAADALVATAGGGVAASDSKLGRALGL